MYDHLDGTELDVSGWFGRMLLGFFVIQ